MGRLENIVARNRRPNRMQERVIVSTVIGVIVLVIIGLAVFTDLGRPPEASEAPAVPGRAKRVDGILLRTPAPRPPRH